MASPQRGDQVRVAAGSLHPGVGRLAMLRRSEMLRHETRSEMLKWAKIDQAAPR